MRLLKLGLVLLALITPDQHYTVTVAFIQPPGETFTAEEQAAVLADAEMAADWWHQLLPNHPDITVEAAGVITATDDIYQELGWTPPVIQTMGTRIYAIDNSSSHRQIELGNGHLTRGLAWRPPFSLARVLSHAGPAVLAHELGHTLFGLPDLYGMPTDIMAQPDIAYPRRTIGCRSLQDFGTPCYRVYLPLQTYSG